MGEPEGVRQGGGREDEGGRKEGRMDEGGRMDGWGEGGRVREEE